MTTCQLMNELQRTEADEMVIKVIPIDLACSYINPSTSLDTAEVHSSRIAYEGR